MGCCRPQAAALESAAGRWVVRPVRTTRKLRSGAVSRGLARSLSVKPVGSRMPAAALQAAFPGPTVRLAPLLLGLLAGGPSIAGWAQGGERRCGHDSLSDARVAAAGFSGVTRLPKNVQMATRSLRSMAWLGCEWQRLGFGAVSGSGRAAFLASRLQRHPVSPARLSCRLREGGGQVGTPGPRETQISQVC